MKTCFSNVLCIAIAANMVGTIIFVTSAASADEPRRARTTNENITKVIRRGPVNKDPIDNVPLSVPVQKAVDNASSEEEPEEEAVAPPTGVIYKSVDAEGRPIFSDQGPEGASEVKVDKPMTYEGSANSRLYQQFTPGEQKVETPPFRYGSLQIQAPMQDATIRENAGNLEIKFTVSPPPQPKHRVELMMDGRVLQEVNSSKPIALTNVDRGTHELQLRVIDMSSRELIQEGEKVSFTILRHSIQH